MCEIHSAKCSEHGSEPGPGPRPVGEFLNEPEPGPFWRAGPGPGRVPSGLQGPSLDVSFKSECLCRCVD